MKLKNKSVVSERPTFDEIRKWYNENLHPDVNNYDDPEVYRNIYHLGRWCSIFQCTSRGAQKFFMKAKPESIVDIAALTSIYRPGPLAAHVDEIYLKAKKGEKYDWGHPLFDEVLGETYNSLIFQEQVMQLVEVVGGFPKDQADNVRRAIMKRDHSKGEQAQREAKAMEDDFVKGATARGVPEETARKAYQNILYFSGYGFNKSVSKSTKIKVRRRSPQNNSLKTLTLPVQDVRPNDLVETRDERTKKSKFVLIKAVHDHGTLPVFKVTLNSGETVTCTLNHKFRTVESGEMLPLWEILRKNYSIVVKS